MGWFKNMFRGSEVCCTCGTTVCCSDIPIECCEWPWPTLDTPPLYPPEDLPLTLKVASNGDLTIYVFNYFSGVIQIRNFYTGINEDTLTGYGYNSDDPNMTYITANKGVPFSSDAPPGYAGYFLWTGVNPSPEVSSCLASVAYGGFIGPDIIVWDMLEDSYTVDFGSGVTIGLTRVVKNVYDAAAPIFGSCNWTGTNGEGSTATLVQGSPGTTPESGTSRIIWQLTVTFSGTDVTDLSGTTSYPVTCPGYKDYSLGNGSSPDQGGGYYELDSTGITPILT